MFPPLIEEDDISMHEAKGIALKLLLQAQSIFNSQHNIAAVRQLIASLPTNCRKSHLTTMVHNAPERSASPSKEGRALNETPAPHGAPPVFSQEKVIIELPPTDDRRHRYLQLTNGLECILVSDPSCDKAAAVMDVGVGSMEDPVNLQGCAHFWSVFEICRNSWSTMVS